MNVNSYVHFSLSRTQYRLCDLPNDSVILSLAHLITFYCFSYTTNNAPSPAYKQCYGQCVLTKLLLLSCAIGYEQKCGISKFHVFINSAPAMSKIRNWHQPQFTAGSNLQRYILHSVKQQTLIS